MQPKLSVNKDNQPGNVESLECVSETHFVSLLDAHRLTHHAPYPSLGGASEALDVYWAPAGPTIVAIVRPCPQSAHRNVCHRWLTEVVAHVLLECHADAVPVLRISLLQPGLDGESHRQPSDIATWCDSIIDALTAYHVRLVHRNASPYHDSKTGKQKPQVNKNRNGVCDASTSSSMCSLRMAAHPEDNYRIG